MRIRISAETYKMFYEDGAEDVYVHYWGEERKRLEASAAVAAGIRLDQCKEYY